MPHRRDDDEEGRDYRSDRKSYPVIIQKNGSHTAWIVGIVSVAIVALAGWGVTNDRAAIEKRLNQADAERSEIRLQLIQVMRDQAVSSVESRQFREDVVGRLSRIERNGEVVKKAVQ